ncbi:MAG: LeuA family protein [Vulcanimicrobiaceae bacterium]
MDDREALLDRAIRGRGGLALEDGWLFDDGRFLVVHDRELRRSAETCLSTSSRPASTRKVRGRAFPRSQAMELREPIERLIRDPKEFTRSIPFPDPHELRLYDETLRDGEQMPGVCYTPAQKYEIATVLAEIGVHIMSVGFPAASAGDRATLQLVMEGKRRGELGDVEIVVMCRSNRSDIDITVQTLREAGIDPREVTFFIFTSGSDLHLKYKIGKMLLRFEGREESEWLDLPLEFYRNANVRLQCDAIAHARACGVERIEFGGEDGSRGDVDYFINHFKAGLQAGGTRPSWPDTVGTLTPEATRWYCSRIVRALPRELPIVAHLHNDYGLGTANAIAATSCGFKVISVTANGYGERAGNVKLHEYTVAMKMLYGIEIPGFKYNKLRDLARFMERMSGVPMQQHEPIIGTKVFAHESGIHTHAMLIDRRMYEAVPSELVGGATSFVFGKHSGVALVEETLRRRRDQLDAAGVELTSSLAHAVTEEIKRLREERAEARSGEQAMALYEDAMRHQMLDEQDVLEVALALGAKAGALAS